jgi:hypothetical protein
MPFTIASRQEVILVDRDIDKCYKSVTVVVGEIFGWPASIATNPTCS